MRLRLTLLITLFAAFALFHRAHAADSAAFSNLTEAQFLRGKHLAKQVHRIFLAKCYECHGPHLANPDGDFGEVMNFHFLRKNEDFIIPGQPNKSYLFDTIIYGDMPPDDSDIPPMTPTEIELVRWWIETGALALTEQDLAELEAANEEIAIDKNGDPASNVYTPRAISTASSALNQTEINRDQTASKLNQAANNPDQDLHITATAAADSAQPAKQPAITHTPPSTSATKKTTPWSAARILNILGQFHLPSTHFPIALLIAAAFAELLYMFTLRDGLKTVVRFCLWLGALSAISAAALGWAEGWHYTIRPSEMWVLNAHRLTGTLTAIWALAAVMWMEIKLPPQSTHKRAGFRSILFFGALLVSAAGFLGGALTYGLNHYSF